MWSSELAVLNLQTLPEADSTSAEVLFPQDVPKIIFIDADQAGG